jgi:predicted DNA-binding protein (MmcQ/YjbR family)
MTLKSSKPPADLARAEQAIAKLAAAYPQVTEDRPWGHRAFKIRGKTFLFLGADADGLGLSVKLPESGVMALELPFTEPTHYGLGKSGWVSASFKSGKDVPLSLVREWLDESFRAIAPKKVGDLLAGAATTVMKTAAKASSMKPAKAAAKDGAASVAPKQRTKASAKKKSSVKARARR